MLCVALAVVFAGASAASVLDGAQHAAKAPHEHGPHLTLSQPEPDHGADHHHDDDRSPADQHTGPGHHHADAPTGALSLPTETPLVLARAEIALSPLATEGSGGVRPGGLERPPKRIAKLV